MSKHATSSSNARLGDTYGDASTCDCPVHSDGNPATVPLGIQFSDRLTVQELTLNEVNEIYQEHHAYMDEVHDACLAHHGVYFDGDLVMAVTYRYPLMSRFKVWAGPDHGQVHRDDSLGADRGDTKSVIAGDRIIEINRVCVVADMANLASAGLCASQEHFLANRGAEEQPDLLLTFVRCDHTGSMIRALADKGWTQAGISSPRASGNREETDINTWDKQRWLFETRYSTLR